jgi:hypothetical protein
LGYATWPLGLLALLGLLAAARRRPPAALLGLIWVAALFLLDVLFLSDAFVRYLVPAAPLVAVYVGVGAAALPPLLRRVVRNRWAAAGLAGLLVAAAAFYAVRFDGQVLANPSTAPYPGASLSEYETDWAAGTGVNALAAKVRQLAVGSPTTFVWYGHLSPELLLALRNDSHASLFVSDGAPANQVASADYVITNDVPLPAHPGLGNLRTVATFTRPRGGQAMVLYQRGIRWKGQFFTNADELRQGLGLDDHRFDAFIASHRFIRAWYYAVSKPS